MADKPTATSYDELNDNSINGTLWTTTVVANASVAEESSEYMHLSVLGNNDADEAIATQDVAGDHGIKCRFKYTMNTGVFNWNEVGITDGINEIYIRLGLVNPIDTKIRLYQTGYTLLTNNSAVYSLAQSTYAILHIYEAPFGVINVEVDSDLIGVLQGPIKTGSYFKGRSRAQSSALRDADLYLDYVYDYDENNDRFQQMKGYMR